jgi:hypothetical protein
MGFYGNSDASIIFRSLHALAECVSQEIAPAHHIDIVDIVGNIDTLNVFQRCLELSGKIPFVLKVLLQVNYPHLR